LGIKKEVGKAGGKGRHVRMSEGLLIVFLPENVSHGELDTKGF
jgi:hypothetical protein